MSSVEPPSLMDAAGDHIVRNPTPPATTMTPASPTRTLSQRRKPKSQPIARPSIDLELAGYRPELGPSPLLADQVTARHVYRAIRQHESDQLKAHPDWNNHLEYLRAKERRKESHRENGKREKLAALNAEAAQAFKVAEQASGISPGKGRTSIHRPVYDNSAWQASPRGHPQQPLPLTADDKPDTVGAASARRGCKSYSSSIESVDGSSPRSSRTHTPEPGLLPSRSSFLFPGDESAPSSSSESKKSVGILRTPTASEPCNIDIVTGSPPRPLVHQRVTQKQWGTTLTLPRRSRQHI